MQWHTPHPPLREAMLELWMRLGKWREQNFPGNRKVRVKITPNQALSAYTHYRDELHIAVNDADPFPIHPSTAELDISAPTTPPPVGRRITMVVPVVAGDKRWESIGLTASDLILGSALARSGYRVSHIHPRFPPGPPQHVLEQSDILGVSLYEDLLPVLRAWGQSAGKKLPAWVAVGGPMVTLNPLPAVAHFPPGNLWVRGDGEEVFPQILNALASGQFVNLKNLGGVLLTKPNLLMAWNFASVNRPPLPVEADFDFSFIAPQAWRKGIEINLSRGCERICVFCSRVQGNNVRRMPQTVVSRMLEKIRDAMPPRTGGKYAGVLNINDDDILQDANYAAGVFQIIHRAGFRLWGVQTSLASVLDNGNPRKEVIDLLSQRRYFANGPLIWFGTDAFLPRRGKLFCKQVPSATQMEQLFSLLQVHDIRHHHYWILSDHISGWLELAEELGLVTRWWREFSNFHILPHSPFLIPYPSTPLFSWVSQPSFKRQIRFRQWLKSSVPCLNYPLVDRVESGFEMLNNMLRGQADGLHPPLLQSLCKRDSVAALETAHYFLRRELLCLDNTSGLGGLALKSLLLAQKKLEAVILENRAGIN